RAASMSATGASGLAPDVRLPPEKAALLERARRVEWTTIGLVATVLVAVGAAAGTSQAMKAIWIEDVLSVVPSAAFLVGARYRSKPADPRFPYGYGRAVLVAFLVGAVTLCSLGLYLLVDSVAKLATA